jgi:putative colanic acid biosysnthesis UDP-glucose lipid carrier transferase
LIHSHPNPTAVVEHGSSRSRRGLLFLSKLIDALVISGVLFAAVTIYDVHDWNAQYTNAVLAAVMLFILPGEIAGVYKPWRGETLGRVILHIFFFWSQIVLVLLLLAFALKDTSNFSRVATGAWILITPILLSGWRIVAVHVYRRLLDRSGLSRNALIWGTGEPGKALARTIGTSPWLGLALSDYIEDTDLDDPSTTPHGGLSAAAESRIRRIEEQARRGEIDILYIALPPTARSIIDALVNRLADTTVSVYLVPDYYTTSLMNGRWSNLAGIPIVSVYETPFWGVDGWVKRIEDVVLSSLILLVIGVPMGIIAAAVKLTSPGPVIFKQRRYGIDGREILVWKFRTMTVCEDGDRFVQATREAPRVTPLGALLRRTSLDELPQFINVLMGDMSIVGPRPHPIAMNEHYRREIKGYMLRHKVRPGITGWAQVNGWRGETDTLEKITRRVEHDLQYIQHWSLWLDMRIIYRTVFCAFRGDNAY